MGGDGALEFSRWCGGQVCFRVLSRWVVNLQGTPLCPLIEATSRFIAYDAVVPGVPSSTYIYLSALRSFHLRSLQQRRIHNRN